MTRTPPKGAPAASGAAQRADDEDAARGPFRHLGRPSKPPALLWAPLWAAPAVRRGPCEAGLTPAALRAPQRRRRSLLTTSDRVTHDNARQRPPAPLALLVSFLRDTCLAIEAASPGGCTGMKASVRRGDGGTSRTPRGPGPGRGAKAPGAPDGGEGARKGSERAHARPTNAGGARGAARAGLGGGGGERKYENRAAFASQERRPRGRGGGGREGGERRERGGELGAQSRGERKRRGVAKGGESAVRVGARKRARAADGVPGPRE